MREKCHAVWERDLGCNCRADVAIETYKKKEAMMEKRKIIRGKDANFRLTEAHKF